MTEALPYEEAEKKLLEIHSWGSNTEELTKRFEFKNFKSALELVNKIGEIAEKHKHHPDISFGWGYVDILITTHSAGGLTEADFKLAKEIDKL